MQNIGIAGGIKKGSTFFCDMAKKFHMHLNMQMAHC